MTVVAHFIASDLSVINKMDVWIFDTFGYPAVRNCIQTLEAEIINGPNMVYNYVVYSSYQLRALEEKTLMHLAFSQYIYNGTKILDLDRMVWMDPTK